VTVQDTITDSLASLETDVADLETGKQDVLTVGDPGKAHYPILSGTTIRSLIGGGGIQLVDDGSEAVVVTVQDTITDSLASLETDVAEHTMLLRHRGRYGSVRLTDPAYGGMKGMYSETPNILIATVIQEVPSTADIRFRMNDDLVGITSIQADTSAGIFLRDSTGSNRVIINATGTATEDLLVDGPLQTTGNAVIGAAGALLSNSIRANGANEVTVDDNLVVTAALGCDTLHPDTAAEVTVDSALTVSGNLKCATIAPTGGNLAVDAVLTVTGSTNVQSLNAGGNVTVASGSMLKANTITATTGDEVTINDTLAVGGNLKCVTVEPSTGTSVAFYSNVHPTGNLTVGGSMPSPFWIAGKVDGTGTTPSVVVSKGRIGFSVSRRNNGIGQYAITFAQNNPDGSDYVITLVQQGTGNIKVQQFTNLVPRANGLDAVPRHDIYPNRRYLLRDGPGLRAYVKS
jgi:hypothetical protein